VRLDCAILNRALAAYQDVIEEVVKRAWDIAKGPMSERSEKLAAQRTLARWQRRACSLIVPQ
jgi:hypothetical protein